MPSSTFFNLPAEKREKLLRCAHAEFARVAYPVASISKIIQAAEIPRGSFYMYFTNKEELFLYLMSTYSARLEALMEQLLSAHSGDLLAAFLALYDDIQAHYGSDSQDKTYENLVKIFRNNNQIRPHVFLYKEGDAAIMARLGAKVDRSFLDLRGGHDLEDMFGILVGVTGSAILNGTLAADPAPIRARLVNIFDILRRGMVKSPAPNEE